MKAETYALLAALLWGLAPVIEKVGLRGMDPMTATLIRSLAAVAFLAVVCPAVGKSQMDGMKYVGYMIVGGILAGGLGLYLYYMALSSGQASRIVPLSSTYPLFATLFSMLVLRERPSVETVIGCVLIVVGAVLVSRE
ncbi:EamA family transporter [Methanopyrus sp.]